MTWYAVDRIESGLAILVPAYFEAAGGSIQVRAARSMREGQVYRWDGRYLRRDTAYEKRARKAAVAAARSLRQGPAGAVRL